MHCQYKSPNVEYLNCKTKITDVMKFQRTEINRNCELNIFICLHSRRGKNSNKFT